jgi:hypothetical protein
MGCYGKRYIKALLEAPEIDIEETSTYFLVMTQEYALSSAATP